MSIFYLVLYIFIGIILLLCLISFGMYIWHLIKANRTKDGDEDEAFISPSTRGLGNVESGLNQTETTQLETSQLEEREVPSASSVTFSKNGRSSKRGEQAPEQIQLINVKNKVSTYEQEHSDLHKTCSEATTIKPTIPTKPLLHVQPSNPRHSVSKPTEKPPPPPLDVKPKSAAPKKTSFKKPKAPPPPPPNKQQQNDGNIYENFNDMNNSSVQCPPPLYDDIIKGIPQDNYLSDND